MDLSMKIKNQLVTELLLVLNMRQAKARKKKGAEAAQAVISVLSQK